MLIQVQLYNHCTGKHNVHMITRQHKELPQGSSFYYTHTPHLPAKHNDDPGLYIALLMCQPYALPHPSCSINTNSSLPLPSELHSDMYTDQGHKATDKTRHSYARACPCHDTGSQTTTLLELLHMAQQMQTPCCNSQQPLERAQPLHTRLLHPKGVLL